MEFWNKGESDEGSSMVIRVPGSRAFGRGAAQGELKDLGVIWDWGDWQLWAWIRPNFGRSSQTTLTHPSRLSSLPSRLTVSSETRSRDGRFWENSRHYSGSTLGALYSVAAYVMFDENDESDDGPTRCGMTTWLR